MEKDKKTSLDPAKTWVPLATVLTVTGALITFVWTAADWRNEIKTNRQATETNTKALTDLSESLNKYIEVNWTTSDMERLLETIRMMNPEFNAPSKIK